MIRCPNDILKEESLIFMLDDFYLSHTLSVHLFFFSFPLVSIDIAVPNAEPLSHLDTAISMRIPFTVRLARDGLWSIRIPLLPTTTARRVRTKRALDLS
jgi:hypothetical protein